MASRGETVKYIIDADTSGFARGMAEASAESEIASKAINKNLTKTSKDSENNFKDIRKSASQSASQIRNFRVALEGFNTTSLIVGVTALSGAVIELSGAIAAAGSTASILFPALVQAGTAVGAFKTGISGLGLAFKALAKNDPKAFAKAMANLGPASQAVVNAAGAINNAFKDIKLNVSQALLAGIGQELLQFGAKVLPVVNAGFQLIGRAFNGLLKDAIALTSTPAFRGLLATVFQDTASNVAVLSKAIQPLLTIFTQLYAVTRPYFALLAQGTVNLLNTAAAYLSSAKGQQGLNAAIQNGILAVRELGAFVSAAFGLLTSLFRSSVNSGNSLIQTLTGIIKQTTAWVNSAQGQADLAALFNFTSLAVRNVARSIGIASQIFFTIIKAIDSLSPRVQTLFIQFLSLALAIGPISSYFLSLFGSIKLVTVVVFNLFEQLIVLAGILGAVSSVVLIVAAVFIILGSIIKGPLGTALIILGIAIATYIGLTYLAATASSAAAESFFAAGVSALIAAEEEAVLAEVNVLVATTMYAVAAAAADAGVGMSFAARGALFLQQALLPLLVIAGAVLVILNLLGVMGNSTKKAKGATNGFSSSLGALQKSLQNVGKTSASVGDSGLSALNQSLGQTADAADTATGSLAGFDKMNVLSSSGSAGITGLPTLPDLGGVGGGSIAPPDTSAFDEAFKNLNTDFDGLSDKFGKGLPNPFKAISDWLKAHPGLGIAVLGIFVAIVAGIFIAFGVAAVAAVIGISATIGLILLAVAAVIIIVILLWKNWDKVTAFMVSAWQWVYAQFQKIGMAIWGFFEMLGNAIGGFLFNAWQFIVGVWNGAVAFFSAIWNAIQTALTIYVQLWISAFQLAWDGVVAIWNLVVGFFQAVWNGITAVFSTVAGFFAGVFQGAWNAITGIFGGIWNWFKTNVWDKIVGIFSSIGSSIGDAISGAFKGVINTAINFVADFINGTIKLINGAIGLINKIPGVNIKSISTITLPKLAQGGIITSPTVAQIGENGAEAVMPLENNTEWIDKLAKKISTSGNTGAAVSTNSDIIPVTNKKDTPTQSITINVSGVFATSTQEQKKVADLIMKQISSSMKAKGVQGAF